jgi:hypothetical protein
VGKEWVEFHGNIDKRSVFMHLMRLLMLVALVGIGVVVPRVAQAQAAPLCFTNVPGITHCIEGRFREYWEQNGGLPVFGYPITAAGNQTTTEGTFLTQYFERNRFELHPDKARPYDVLLGRLGDDRLKQMGRDWTTLPKGQQTAGCLWFAETGHSVCDQESGAGFRSYWESHGLQDPALNAYQRSLALFGLPLSEPAMETNAAGATVMTQWFERARFEWHPTNPREFRVLLGLLGNEIRAGAPAGRVDPCASIEAPVDAVIEPNCVRFGETFGVLVFGFSPDQEIGYWITDTAGRHVGTTQSVRTDEDGAFGGYVDTLDFFGVELRPGDYVFVSQDKERRLRSSTAPFRVLP